MTEYSFFRNIFSKNGENFPVNISLSTGQRMNSQQMHNVASSSVVVVVVVVHVVVHVHS